MPWVNYSGHRKKVSNRIAGFSKRRKVGKLFKAKVQKVITSNTEKKYFPFSQTATAVDFAGTIIDVSAVAQGTNDTQHVGDTIRVRSVENNISWVAGDNTNLCRYILFQWKQSGVPAVADILLGPLSTTVAPLSPYNHDNRKNFNVLYDSMVKVDAVALPLTVRKSKIWKIPSFLRQMYFTAATTNRLKNGIYILVISDSGAVPHPTFAFNYKMNFSDS